MKFKSISAVFSISALLLVSVHAHAAVIAIADSGTDVGHPDLAKKLWNNPGELDNGVDNDDDGYIGDVHGWNFVDGNNHYYNKKLVGTYPQEVFQFFEIQTRVLEGAATADDKTWIKSHEDDAKFLASLEDFGNFVHGTHVAGISSKNVDAAQIMALKIIGKKTAYLFTSAVKSQARLLGGLNPSILDKVIKYGLDYLAQAQSVALGPVGQYIGLKNAQVVNCSFGTSAAELTPVLKPLLKMVEPAITDAQIAGYVSYTINQITKVTEKSFILAAPNALFVIAAGNDGTNNDELPASPANVKLDNTITVAATLQNTKLASFSNFGAENVDIAAPGVGILSSIPGNTHLLLSGTSQATPAVTNIAGQILDANPKLSPGEVKQILMGTVDHRVWLEGKVKSEGTANVDRAVFAAKASVSMNLSDAILAAKNSVSMVSVMDIPSIDEDYLYVTPLPALVQ